MAAISTYEFGQATAGRDLLLIEIGILGLLAVATGAWFVVPLAAALLVAPMLLLFLVQAPLRHAVIVFLCLMMFDLQRQVGSGWIYIDLSFATLLIPVARIRRMPRFWWVFVPYTAYLLIDGIPRSLNRNWYFGFALRSIIAVIAYLACALADVEDVYFVILGVVMIPLTVYGAYQLAIGDMGVLYGWMNPHFFPLPWMGRAYSLLWQPNFFGGVASITLVALVALALKGQRPRLSYALALVCLIGLLCSGSRGGMIGAALGICFVATITGRAKLIVILIVLALTVFMAGHILDIALIQRLSRADELSNRGRLLGNEIGIAEFIKNPIFGLGPTNFEVILPTVPEWEYVATMPVNNTYLQHLAELGILGFYSFWIPVLLLARAAWKQRSDPIVLACLSMLVVFAVHGLFDYMLELGPSYLFLVYSFAGVLAGRLGKLSAKPTTLIDITNGPETTGHYA